MEPRPATRTDKGQIASQMAMKGQNIEVVEEVIRANPSSIEMTGTKGNTA